MSSKFTPKHGIMSESKPTPQELAIDASLRSYMDSEMKLETVEAREHRKSVLKKLEEMFLEWVVDVAVNVLKRMSMDDALAAIAEKNNSELGQLFISGSHKLGVGEPNADIDTVCVTPNFCTQDHFFHIFGPKLKAHKDVTEFNAVEGSKVPIMSFDFEGVSIDLLFAQLSEDHVPKDFHEVILDDKTISCLEDDKSVFSLNGPRVTMMISELVTCRTGDPKMENFLVLLRCIRRWAKKRGLYGNKFGYFGGVNCNILAALICQMYPKACPSILLFKFFSIYSSWNWDWEMPVTLCAVRKPPETKKDRPVYPETFLSRRDQYDPADPRSSQYFSRTHLMPILTPAYPSANSSESVTEDSRLVITQEFARAKRTMMAILPAEKKQSGEKVEVDWAQLFEPSDFFLRYAHYLQCNIIGTGDDADTRAWFGIIESRIRGFASSLRDYHGMPLRLPVHLHPAQLATDRSAKACCYFIGFDIDMAEVEKNPDNRELRFDERGAEFLENLRRVPAFQGRQGLDFVVEHFPWRRLPPAVFMSIGGREVAKAKRAKLFGVGRTPAGVGVEAGLRAATPGGKAAGKEAGGAPSASGAEQVKVEGSSPVRVVLGAGAASAKGMETMDGGTISRTLFEESIAGGGGGASDGVKGVEGEGVHPASSKKRVRMDEDAAAMSVNGGTKAMAVQTLPILLAPQRKFVASPRVVGVTWTTLEK